MVRKSAVEKLSAVGMAFQVVPGPLVITGVARMQSISEDGVYSICLPLHNGLHAIFTGLCLPKVTSEFATYRLGDVEKDILEACGNFAPFYFCVD